MLFAIVYLVVLTICYRMDAAINHKYGLQLNERKIHTSFHFVFIIFLMLIFAYRSLDTGSDTQSYARVFYGAKYTTFKEIFDADASQEYLFYIITKIISNFTEDTVVFFGIFGGFFAFAYGKIVQKNSENYFISYLMFVALYFAFVISGMRQVAAMSVLLLSYPFIIKKKLIPFLLCVAVAYFFHNTAIIFLLAYPIAHMKFGAKSFAIIGISVVLAFVFPQFSEKILYEWLAWERIASYETYDRMLSVSGFIIKSCIFLFNLVFYKNTVEQNSNNKLLYNLSVMSVSMEAFTAVMSQAFRVSAYFGIFDTILTANVVLLLPSDTLKEKNNKRLVTIGVIGVLLLYYLLISEPFEYQLVER